MKKVLLFTSFIIIVVMCLASGVVACAEIISTGDCGLNAKWTLDDSGTFTISGTGDMYDYDVAETPWWSERKNITNVVIAEGITNIGESAFLDCQYMKSIQIPTTVTRCGTDAFYACWSLKDVNIFNVDKWFDIDFNGENSSPCYNGGASIHLNNQDIVKYTIPSGKTTIGEFAFCGFTALESITIPDSVTTIGGYAFFNCKNLAEIDIPDAVTEIAEYAFYNSSGLSKIQLPEGVTEIKDYTFAECVALESVTLPATLKEIGMCAFKNCKNIANVYISDIEAWCKTTLSRYDEGATPFYYGATIYVDGEILTDLVIPETITTIQPRAFYNCKSIESIVISDNVTDIGYSAFYGCSNAKTLTVGKSVANIEGGAFDTISLETIYWNSNNVADIAPGVCLFAGEGENGSRINAIFGENVTRIPANLFYPSYPETSYYVNVTTVTIPYSVKSIGEAAFWYCLNLTSVNYVGSEQQWSAVDIGSLNNRLESATLYPLEITALNIIKGASKIEAELTTNFSLSDALIYIASYDSKDELIEVKTVSADNMKAGMSNKDVSYIKAFIWESRNSLVALCENKTASI